MTDRLPKPLAEVFAMQTRATTPTLALVVLALTASQPAPTDAADCGLVAGPDVVIGDIVSVRRWGESGGFNAYSYAPTLCNIGDTDAVFMVNTNLHPVTVHNLYRWRPHTPGAPHGSFQQIGMSWASHHLFALSGNNCCTDCVPTNGSTLGVRCSSAESASIMGSAAALGPRSDVNPVTGAFSAFPTPPSGPVTLAGRVQAPNADLDQTDALNADAQYFVENQTISPDDAANNADGNNVSHRPGMVSSAGVTHNIALAGPTEQAPAIFAWAGIEPDVLIDSIDIPADGRFFIASNASDDDGDGTWRYEYAVYNMNSAEATAEFTVPVPPGVTVTNITSRDVDHHSGEPYDTANWSGTRAATAVHWNAQPITPSSNTNAIRWGTLHSFGFDADTAPVTASASLTLFVSGGTSPAFNIKAPGAPCLTDLNGDGLTDAADLGILLGAFGSAGPLADLNNDGAVDAADLGILLSAFASPC